MAGDDQDRLAVSDEADDQSANGSNPYRSPRTDEVTTHRHPLAWIVRHIVGWGALAIGIVGLVLPILPGWPFIIWGVFSLAPDIPIFARWLELIERKVPGLRPIIERVRGDGPELRKRHSR
jgi:hypothetical protein